jgi:hypothetical protein
MFYLRPDAGGLPFRPLRSSLRPFEGGVVALIAPPTSPVTLPSLFAVFAFVVTSLFFYDGRCSRLVVPVILQAEVSLWGSVFK